MLNIKLRYNTGQTTWFSCLLRHPNIHLGVTVHTSAVGIITADFGNDTTAAGIKTAVKRYTNLSGNCDVMATPIIMEVVQLSVCECTSNPSMVNGVVETMHVGNWP